MCWKAMVLYNLPYTLNVWLRSLEKLTPWSKVGTFFNNSRLFTAHLGKFEGYEGDGMCVNCEFSEKNHFFQILTEYRKIVQI